MTAYREAGHAVVAAHYGWWIVEPGICIDPPRQVRFYCHAPTKSAAATVAVSLAGELAARLSVGVHPSDYRSRDDFDDMYDDIVEGWGAFEGAAEANALRVVIERRPDMRPPRLYNFFDRLERCTLRFIRRPEIWARIDGLASVLIERGELSPDDAMTVMADLGC